MGVDLGSGFLGRSPSTDGGRSLNQNHLLIDKNVEHHGGQAGKLQEQCRLAG